VSRRVWLINLYKKIILVNINKEQIRINKIIKIFQDIIRYVFKYTDSFFY